MKSCVKGFLALGWAGLVLVACAPPGRNVLSPTPQRPSIATVDLAHAESGRVPLVTIPAGTAPADYLSVLAGAVRDAEARKPDVAFDIVSTVPQIGTPLAQITEAKALTPQTAEVGGAVQAAGAPPPRVTLGAMIAAGAPGEQIRVYVR